MAIRILLAVTDFRDCQMLTNHLSGMDSVESVFAASDERSALDLLRNSHVNILIIDSNFADDDSLDLISSISDEYPQIKMYNFT